MTITVYHGSSIKFDNPSLVKCKEYRDFGRGFYVTENYLDVLNILKCKSGYVYEYQIDLKGLSIKEITNDEEFVDCVIKNRTTVEAEKFKYDVVIGKTATGYCSKLFKEIRNKSTSINKEEIKRRILGESYGEQMCIKTEIGLSKITLRKIEYYDKSDFN